MTQRRRVAGACILFLRCGHPPAVAERERASSSPSPPTCAPLRHWSEMASPGTDVTPQAADLDGIAPLDAVLPLGQCGNWGDCMYVVLLACGGSGYRPIWGPDYAQRIEVLQRTPDAPLANLRYIDRTAAAGCDLAVQTVLHWSGGSWIGGASCTSSGVWDVEVCGPLPAPRCSG